jgi:hypothetical protein
MENTENVQATPQAEPRSDTAVGSNPLLDGDATKPKPWEHNGTDEIVCPYCGYEHGDSWEFAERASAGECDCDGCGKRFRWTQEIAVTYDTEAV